MKVCVALIVVVFSALAVKSQTIVYEVRYDSVCESRQRTYRIARDADGKVISETRLGCVDR